jgi:hypothetical protein
LTEPPDGLYYTHNLNTERLVEYDLMDYSFYLEAEREAMLSDAVTEEYPAEEQSEVLDQEIKHMLEII